MPLKQRLSGQLQTITMRLDAGAHPHAPVVHRFGKSDTDAQQSDIPTVPPLAVQRSARPPSLAETSVGPVSVATSGAGPVSVATSVAGPVSIATSVGGVVSCAASLFCTVIDPAQLERCRGIAIHG